MPDGKPAGVRCLHLGENFRCALWKDPRRPLVCAAFKAEVAICGGSRSEALQILTLMEQTG